MERKVKQALILSGAFMSAAVALVPLTSYADSVCNPGGIATPGQPCVTVYSEQGTTEVQVKVDNLLSIDAAGSDAAIPAFPNTLREGVFPVTVRSAVPYTISLAADETNLVNVEDENYMIPARALPGDKEEAAGKLGWGIKKVGDTDYSAIRQDSQVFFDSGNDVADDGIETEFEVGVAVTNATVQGTYATEITVTAAVK